ncbi:MAG: FAD-dependent oxidoreductase [Gammaproteobacteria bacterium HGW-Gammaproteobacteria-10]|nr:MAG: FAD-dependent oxidoreductase [Gammaproteobacteria bacterium HGW-Gammaproteobacteria-10]
MTSIPDITIIGGGIIGLLTARELSMAGARVSILEKNAIGRESSWAGGGILLPIYPWRQPSAISELVRHSLDIYPTLATELKESTGIDPEWSPCGLFISRNPDIEQAVDWCDRYSINYRTEQTPSLDNLNCDTLNSLWLPDIAHARNPRLLKSARRDAENRNVELIEHCDVQNVTVKNGRIVSLTTDRGERPVGHLTICAGAWTKTLFERFFSEFAAPEIQPIKGQMLLYDAPPDLLPGMILENDHYLIPRLDGKILVGSSVEHCGFDKSTSEATYRRLKSFAEHLCPALKTMPIITHWAGLRPGTDHGVPYIFRHPDLDNLCVNAGHFRNGLVMAPASARLMADLILGKTPLIEPEPYSLFAPH